MKQKHFTLTQVKSRNRGLLHVEFADGLKADVELEVIIDRHPALGPLSDPHIFHSVRMDEWNLGVIFDDQDELGLASDTLRALAVEQAGGFSHQQMITWMAHHRMSLDAAAQALGISRRMLAYYRSGQKPIPRPVGLAMVGWDIVQAQGVGTVLHYNAA